MTSSLRHLCVSLVVCLGAVCACSSPTATHPATSSKAPASPTTSSDDPAPQADAKPKRLRISETNPAEVPHFAPEYAPPDMTPPPPAEDAFPASFVRGVAVGLYLDLPDLSYARVFREVRAHGATHVSLVISWSQQSIRSVELAPDPVETLPDARLEEIIALAHKEGLRVTLFPIIHLKRRRSGEWRGLLNPTLPKRWWASYTRFVLHYAKLAERTKVASFSVGSELLSLEHERGRWLSVIEKTRAAYTGTLLYSSNWDHFHGVTFWDKLDWAGMTGYFELSTSKKPSFKDYKDTWKSAIPVIEAFAQKISKPLVITEVGYPSQIGGAAHPWDYTLDNPIHHRTQYLAYRAMYEAWLERAQERPRRDLGLHGVFFWCWNGYGGAGDGHYTPRGKPASAILKRWFALPNAPAQTPVSPTSPNTPTPPTTTPTP